MMNWASSMNWIVVRPSDSTQRSMISWPPSSAKDAEKIEEPTKSQHTIAVVLAVRKDDSLTMPPTSFTVVKTALPFPPLSAAM